jgi:GGDEF domain-containing protein
MDNMDPELAAVLHRIRGQQQLRPEDADLLEHHLTSDSLVPGVRNRAAWNQHVRHHSNAGVYVHADLNDFGLVNKQHGEDAGDEAIKNFGSVLSTAGRPFAARIFRKGGDEFVAWLLRPEDAKGFTDAVQQGLTDLKQMPLSASLGVGFGRLQAEAAMREAKAQKNGEPQTHIVSKLNGSPPMGWLHAEENIKKLRREAIKGGREADVSKVPGIDGSRVEHRHDVTAALTKAEPEQPAPAPVQSTHPVLAGGRGFTFISGEEPRYPARQSGHDALRNELIGRGRHFEEIQGLYGKPERSFIVYDMPLHEARSLGKDFGQESVIHSDGQKPIFFYTNGEDADHYHPINGSKTFAQPPADNWSRLVDPATKQPVYMSYDIDWGTKSPLRTLEAGHHPHDYPWHDQDGVEPPQETPSPVQLVKDERISAYSEVQPEHFESAISKHPNQASLDTKRSYEGKRTFLSHDGQSGFALKGDGEICHVFSMTPGHGAHAMQHAIAQGGKHLNAFDGKLADYYKRFGFQETHREPNWTPGGPDVVFMSLGKAEVNDQLATAGVQTFAPTVAPWGKVNPGTRTNIHNYDLRPYRQEIEDMARSYGYQYKTMGPGNVPDLRKDNYNHRSLWIWDPQDASESDHGEKAYTDTWRKLHELSHALTYADINAKYGEGRRIGKLGIHRTPHEAKRAIEWEWHAVQKQRELAAKLGHHISDEAFNRERNTTIADAVHRAVFGTFTEPSAEGFEPHAHEVPLEQAFKVIDDHAARMGLGPHETLKTKAAQPVPVTA